LRTPLNAVIGYADLMLTGLGKNLNPKQVDYLGRILSNGERLLTLINDVLDLSKIEAGRLELVMEPFSPTELLGDLRSQLQSLADAKSLAFVTSVDPRLPKRMVSDRERLQQIAVNLVSNAIKFTDSGKVDVHFGKAGPSHWEMSVTDTGVGIPAHAQEYIFDEFRQVDGTSERKRDGAGLGLAIVRRLTAMMDGQVRVKSKAGKGSTFTVRLPILLSEPEVVV
jgi:signal transduction histidine kinase